VQPSRHGDLVVTIFHPVTRLMLMIELARWIDASWKSAAS
jgi:hypothetical protein